jgi:hypothetical protein
MAAILDFDPVRTQSGAITAISMLRNDTLKPELAGVLEHRRADLAFHVLAELNAVDGLVSAARAA